jgi:transcription-repair coupling factor (superfamily II helicase)
MQNDKVILHEAQERRGRIVQNLIDLLLTLPQVRELAQAVARGDTPAQLTGLGPVHRAQIAAAVRQAAQRPLLMLCADERDADRLAADLRLLTGKTVTVLPRREWQLRPSAASRDWEHRRLQALYDMADAEIVVATADAMTQRSIPPEVLAQNTFALTADGRYDTADLTRRLIAAGYARADQVEGPGQFALRGGILDVFSPGMDQPVRCEFFDDEVDSLGWFDVATQRRTANCRRALILPAGEVLPHRGDAVGIANRLESAAARVKGESGQRLRATAASDAEQLRQGLTPAGTDRYMAAVYPDMTTALDYLHPDTLICVSDSARVGEALKASAWQLKEDLSAAMEAGHLCGAFADLALGEGDLQRKLSAFPLCQL